VALQALTLLQTRAPDFTVVCTGNTNDYRNPLYFGRLLSKISAAGLRDRFIVLGYVPYEHTFALMRQSLAVLQTSLFEGWSTSVEEALSLGKRVIASDLPVHREKALPCADFFDPNDAEALAEALVHVAATATAGQDRKLEEMARSLLSERTRACAELFLEIAGEVAPGGR